MSLSPEAIQAIGQSVKTIIKMTMEKPPKETTDIIRRAMPDHVKEWVWSFLTQEGFVKFNSDEYLNSRKIDGVKPSEYMIKLSVMLENDQYALLAARCVYQAVFSLNDSPTKAANIQHASNMIEVMKNSLNMARTTLDKMDGGEIHDTEVYQTFMRRVEAMKSMMSAP